MYLRQKKEKWLGGDDFSKRLIVWLVLIMIRWQAITSLTVICYVVVGRALWETGVIDVFGTAMESSFMQRDDVASMRNLFGSAVVGRGNLTGKGISDVIIGAPNAGGRHGGVFLWRYVP